MEREINDEPFQQESEADHLLKSDTEEEENIQIQSCNYEKAMASCGFGSFQKLLLVICGWALASDSTEVQVVSFVLPAACDLEMTSSEKGWLNGIIFVGMMVGGYTFGGTADIKGRRYVLLWSMTINGIFGLLSSFAPSFGWFLFLRLLSGVGVGAAMPVLFSYFVEFITKEYRGRMISILASFWMVGNIMTAGIAWFIIPRVTMGGKIRNLTYGSWRIFVAVGAFPSLSSALFFLFLPESPKFLLQTKQGEKAKEALLKIYRRNNGDHAEIPQEIQDLRYDGRPNETRDEVEYSNPDQCTFCQYLCNCVKMLNKVLRSTGQLFGRSLRKASIALVIIWSTLSFGYYGLWMWFPEIFERIERGDGGCSTGGKHHSANMTHLNNMTCLERVANENEIYFQSFIIALGNLPGNILTFILIDRLGRRQLLAASMVLAAVAVFFFWFVDTKAKMLAMSCLFSGLTVAGWNALDALALENYPTNLRASAFGLQASVGRISAILGNVVFGELVDVHCSIPLLTVSALLLGGGLSAFLLPKTDDSDLK